MPEENIDLLGARLGSVTAPAGCGKTELIAQTLRNYAGEKPILILTHTNAGVAALRGRLSRSGVLAKKYRLSTLDGWAMRLIGTFPNRSNVNTASLLLRNPRQDYPIIRDAAAKLIASGHISDVLTASYAHLIVDEYQDCSIPQHMIVGYASTAIPTCVLGDPLQAIFSFSGPMPDWTEHVCGHFPEIGTLSQPWRWVKAETEAFGRWLLTVRTQLLRGEPIDLRHAPPEVKWVSLDGADDDKRRLEAARTRGTAPNDNVLVIGYSKRPHRQREFASKIPGAHAVEAVDLADLTAFAGNLHLSHADALDVVVAFAETIMTNVGAEDYIQRIYNLRRGAADRAPSGSEKAGLDFLSAPTYAGVANVLVEIGKTPGISNFRPGIFRACLKALQLCSASGDRTHFYDAAVEIREQSRIVSRSISGRAVGSTLLLKGLEAEVAVILDADELDPKHLYVSMTRGSKMLVICSKSPVLQPHLVRQ